MKSTVFPKQIQEAPSILRARAGIMNSKETLVNVNNLEKMSVIAGYDSWQSERDLRQKAAPTSSGL
jgi:hypothetical protein